MTGRVAWPLGLGIVLAGAWELAVGAGHVPAYIVPSPASVVQAFWSDFGMLWSATAVSGANALWGLVTGAVAAATVATVAERWRRLDSVFAALAAGAAAVPIVAMAPLFYGMYSNISEFPRRLVVALVVFFPVYVSVGKGLRQVSALHRDLMHSYAASRRDFLRHVQVPTLLPYLFAGLRIAAPGAVIASIVSEYFGGPRNGLAALIVDAADSSSYSQAWAFVSASVLLGLVAYVGTTVLEMVADHRLGFQA